MPSSSIVAGGRGWSVEVDGCGTLILTRSSFLNKNRNPGVSQEKIEMELSGLLGIDTFVWLSGIKSTEMTDGHVDSFARIAPDGSIMLASECDPDLPDFEATRRHLNIVSDLVRTGSRQSHFCCLDNPSRVRKSLTSSDAAVTYLNYYVANGVVFVPQFGDRYRDRLSQEIIGRHFPERRVVAVNIDPIVAGGGGNSLYYPESASSFERKLT